MKTIALIILHLFLITGVNASERITDRNWAQHPEIKKVRILYNKINGEQKKGKLKRQGKKCVLYGGSVVIDGEIYRDHNSIVRKYTVDGGSGDSRSRAEYYYNERGIPRFTYRYRGAVNGTKVHERIYFDEKGKHIYTNRKEKGPGYSPSGFADSVADPKADYAKLCEE